MGLFSNSSASTTAINEQAAGQGGSGSGATIVAGAGSNSAPEGGVAVSESNLSNVSIVTSDPIVAEDAINSATTGELAALQVASNAQDALLSHAQPDDSAQFSPTVASAAVAPVVSPPLFSDKTLIIAGISGLLLLVLIFKK